MGGREREGEGEREGERERERVHYYEPLITAFARFFADM